MDWLSFKFCVFIWVYCVSKSQSQIINATNSIISNELRTTCVEGQPVTSPDQCNTCICFDGQIYCTHLPCPEQDCENDGELPKPDPCNKCVCRRGKVTCSDRICIPAPQCVENQLYPAQNECNACICVSGYITCTTNSCDKELKLQTAPITTSKPKKKKHCVEGTRLPGPNDCIECFCQNGRKRCKLICNKPIMESRFKEPECVSGQHISRPDDCNNCICFEGQIHCTHMPCPRDARIGPECRDDQPVVRLDECNECYCFEGRLECSDLVCIRGSKCVEGEVISKPDSCNACKCVEGHILCTDYQCPIPVSRNSLQLDVKPLVECQDGDVIPPPLPPNDCNTCVCMENAILCSTKSCVTPDPEINGRLGEQKEQTDLEIYDKQISMEPFISMLSKQYDKSPTKLIHTHAYNGFHQEIKIHSSKLPKNATQLLQALANSLDNSVLASISQRLLSSSDDDQGDQTNVSSKETVITQSTKLITSGSLSNETILVVPNNEPYSNQNSQSVLPLTTKHETIWKSVSAPPPLVSSNDKIYQHDIKGNPSQFGIPGFAHLLPKNPTSNKVEMPNVNTQSIYQTMKPKLMNNNDGKMSYTPFFNENNPFKHHHPYQLTKPGPNIFNFSSPHPVHKPGNFIVTPNNIGGQKQPSQSQFLPNQSKFYPNQVKPHQYQLKPNQNQLPNLNNNGIPRQTLFPNKPTQPIVSGNQYKSSPFGLKPGPGNIGPLNNKGNQSDQQFKSKLPQNFQINPPLNNLPAQKKHVSFRGFDDEHDVPTFSESASDSSNILNSPENEVNLEPAQHKSLHSQFDLNPPVDYELPKVNDLNPDQKQVQPYSIIYNESYDPLLTFSDSDLKTLPGILNRTKKGGIVPNHSHYKKHTTITVVSEYDTSDENKPNQVGLDSNNTPYNNVYGPYLPEMLITDYESLDPDIITSKVNYYLNLPNLQLDQNEPYPKLTKYNSSHHFIFPGQQQNDTLKVLLNKYSQPDPWNKSNHHFDKFNNSPNNDYSGQIKLGGHLQSPSQFELSQDQSKKQGFPEGFQFPSDLPKGLTNSTRLKPLPPQSLSEPTQNTPKVFDDSGSIKGFQYSHNIYEDPRQLKPLKKETPQTSDKLVSTNSLQYTSNPAGDPLHPQLNKHISNSDPAHLKDNLHDPSFVASQNQLKPGVLDNREVNERYKYGHNAKEIPINFKPAHKLPQSSFDPTEIQHKPGMFNEPGSADPNSTENPVHTRGNLHNHPSTKLGLSENQHNNYPSSSSPNQNQQTLGQVNDRGSPDDLHHNHFVENLTHPNDSLHNLLHSPSSPIQNQNLPGFLDNLNKHYPSLSSPNQNQQTQTQVDDRGSPDGFHHPSSFLENLTHPKDSLHNSPHYQSSPTQNQNLPSFLDNLNKHYPPSSSPNQNQYIPGQVNDRGSPDGFHHPSSFLENLTHPKDSLHNSPHYQSSPTQNQNLPGFLDNRSKHNPSSLSPTQNQHTPGQFDDRGSPDGFLHPSSFVENLTHPKDSLHNLLHSQSSPTQNPHLPSFLDNLNKHYPPSSSPNQNQHIPGQVNDRGSPDGFYHPSSYVENLTHPKDSLQNPSHTQSSPNQNQHLPGMFGDRESPDGFHNPTNSAGDPIFSKGKPPNSPFSSIQNQHLPGMFDGRASPDSFRKPTNSAGDSIHSRGKPPNSPFGPSQNQHLPGKFEDRTSPDGFRNPTNSAGDSIHSRGKRPNFPFGQSPNQNLPEMFGDSESPDGFHNPTNFAGDPIFSKGKPPNSPFSSIQNQHLPGMFDGRASPDSFRNPTNSAGDSIHSRGKPHNSPFGPSQNQHLPGKFDDRTSPDGFHNPTNSAGDSIHSRGKPPNSPFGPSQKQHLPGKFDDRTSPDGFHNPTNSAGDSIHSKDKPPNSPFGPSQNQHLPGMFDNAASDDGFHYPSDSTGDPTHSRIEPLNSSLGLTQNQPAISNHSPGFDDHIHYSAEDSKHSTDQLPKSSFAPTQTQLVPGIIDAPASADSFHYPSNSAENSTHSKGKPAESLVNSTQNPYIPGILDAPGSADGSYHTLNSAESPTHSELNVELDDHASGNGLNHPNNSSINFTHPDGEPINTLFGPTQTQNLSGVFDDRAPIDKYISNSAENPASLKYESSNSEFKPIQNQSKHLSLDFDKDPKENENQTEKPSILDPKNTVVTKNNNVNPLKPWIHLEHDQHKPLFFDSIFNGVHNTPWLLPGDHNNDSNSVTSTTESGVQSDHDKYKPSFFNQLFKGGHNIPWSVPNLVNNALVYYNEITTPSSGLKPEQDQPSNNQNASLSLPNRNGNTSDTDHNQLQTEQDMSTPSMNPIDSDSAQYNPLLNPVGDSNSLIPNDDDKNSDYYDQLLPLFMAAKKLSEPILIGKNESSTDQLNLLHFLSPGIAKMFNFEPSSEQDDESTLENDEVELPDIVNGILGWVQSKVKKYIPAEYNATVTQNGMNITKIMNFLSKLTPPKIKQTAKKLNISFSSSYPKMIEKITSLFEEDTISTTPSTSHTLSYETRFNAVPTVPKDNREQPLQLIYPDVHIILHQADEEDDEDLPSYLETLAGDLSADTGLVGSGASSIPNSFKPRIKHRPKDHKEECGDGTQWISNCHGCSCYFGRAMCFKIPDCELRPFGEPMTCKPYSHFKLGDCYTCECSGDGVAECDATNCKTEPGGKSEDATESLLPVFNEFFDDKKTKDILEYYSIHKKLPKDCPEEDLQALYPTCERGTSWVSSCHKCECDEIGKPKCVKIDDCKLDYDSYGKPNRCKPNSKFYPKTNSLPCVECKCDDEGIPNCPGSDNKT